MARVVEGNLGVEFTGPAGDTEFVEDEVGEFEGAAAHVLDDGQVVLFFELKRVAVSVHGGAGSGRDDDREFAGKDFGGVAGDFAGRFPVA